MVLRLEQVVCRKNSGSSGDRAGEEGEGRGARDRVVRSCLDERSLFLLCLHPCTPTPHITHTRVHTSVLGHEGRGGDLGRRTGKAWPDLWPHRGHEAGLPHRVPVEQAWVEGGEGGESFFLTCDVKGTP